MTGGEMMKFPKTVDEFMESYKIVDTEQLYTNGSELVPIFRMRQWFEHLNEAKWISVNNRLPEDDIICILTDGVSDAIGYRGKVFGWHLIWTDHLEESKVTHWMPLPEPPEEGGGEDGN